MSEFDLEPLDLTEGEKNHPLWIKLSAHFEEQLRVLRSKNDGALTEVQTASLRGHIKFLKAAIRLGESRPLTGD